MFINYNVKLYISFVICSSKMLAIKAHSIKELHYCYQGQNNIVPINPVLDSNYPIHAGGKVFKTTKTVFQLVLLAIKQRLLLH